MADKRNVLDTVTLRPGEDERTREAINALLVRDGSTVRDQRGTGSLGAVP